MSSPIVDIRKIRSAKEVIRYVAKYVTKKPAQFGTAKRYWASQHYNPPAEAYVNPTMPSGYPWLLSRVTLRAIGDEFRARGYTIYRLENEVLYMYPGARALC